jgi:cobalt-zinc-cadmium efflux system outer membrane protein
MCATVPPAVAWGQNEAAPAPAGVHVALSDAVKLARTKGYDVLGASAAVRGAEADVHAAGATPNPIANGQVGVSTSCSTGSSCSGSPWGWGVGLSDNGLVEGALTRKRALKESAAERAVEAAKFGRADAERVLAAQAKIQYVQTAAAALKIDFTKDVAASLAKSVEINRVRYPRVIDEGQLARVEQEALKADQEVDRARRDFRQQQIELAFILGMQGSIPEIAVDKEVLKFRVPDALAQTNKEALFKTAYDNRPDRRQAAARQAQSDAQIAFAKRSRFPDVSLSVNYAQQGTGDYTSSLPTWTFGAQLPIPLFYQQQGEVQRAEADREAASIQLQKIDGALSADIESAYNAFLVAKAIVERFENSLLERAKKAREITSIQYNAGSGTLTDLLDANRSFVQVNSDYYAELVNYWTAVFLLEQATGKEIVP